MGPPCGLRVERVVTSCMVMIARHVRAQPASSIGNNVDTKGKGQREPFSCSLNEAGQQAKFSSIGGYRNVVTIAVGSYRQSCTPRCLPKQGIISAQISQLTRKVKQNNGKENVSIHLIRTMEREKCLNTNIRSISFQGQAVGDIHDMIVSRLPFR